MAQQLRHAYKQAPWRKQVRSITWILLFLVVFVIIAIANLNISAKTYAAGIEIQSLEKEKETLSLEIADLRNELGSITSFEEMSARASEAGYSTVTDTERIVYITIPGYQEPVVEIDAPISVETGEQPVLKPAYTQSLWDLFLDGALKFGKSQQRNLR